jgi:hypothetical protein
MIILLLLIPLPEIPYDDRVEIADSIKGTGAFGGI